MEKSISCLIPEVSGAASHPCHSWACRHIPPVSALLHMLFSLCVYVCISVFSSYEDTSHCIKAHPLLYDLTLKWRHLQRPHFHRRSHLQIPEIIFLWDTILPPTPRNTLVWIIIFKFFPFQLHNPIYPLYFNQVLTGLQSFATERVLTDTDTSNHPIN